MRVIVSERKGVLRFRGGRELQSFVVWTFFFKQFAQTTFQQEDTGIKIFLEKWSKGQIKNAFSEAK